MRFLKIAMLAASAMVAAPNMGMAVESDRTVNMAIFWLDADIEPTSGWNGWTLTRSGVGENLVQIDENLTFKPVVAESWEKIDELTTVFHIREGVTFQNGKKVDAAAVKASIQRALDITDRQDMQLPIMSMVAKGQTLTLTTSRPYATLINTLADPVFILVDSEAADTENFRFKPVTTGPFMVESFSQETGLVLKKYSGYWRGEPDVDTVNVKYISDATTRSLALQSGELDFAPQISPSDLELLRKKPDLEVLSGPNLRIFMARTNLNKPWMKDPAFRKAIRHAIQKDVYAERIAMAIPARGPFNSMLPFGHEGDDAYPYDIESAKKLLDDAGYIDSTGDGFREFNGEKLELLYVSMTNHGNSARNIGLAMQSDLKKVGIDLTVQQLENFAEAAQQGRYDFLFERWTSAPTLDPQYFLEASFGTGARGNLGNYSNPEFDALLEELRNTIDTDARHSLGAKGAQILMDDAASIFLFYERGNVVHNKRIGGVYKFPAEVNYIDGRLTITND